MNGTVTIRRATRGDAAALERIARLDSSRPLTGYVLVAEIDGEPLAAVAPATGAVVADPFRRTAELVALLRMRAEQDESRTESRARRLRAIGARSAAARAAA